MKLKSIFLSFAIISGCQEAKNEAGTDRDGDGFTEEQGDCDDGEATTNPEAFEICDGIDNNCDGVIDDSESLSESSGENYYYDVDGDGFGDSESEMRACEIPEDGITAGGDCNDNNVEINPEAQEICDSVDNDCDGMTDDEDEDLDLESASQFYQDSDGDGYGNSEQIEKACVAPDGYVDRDSDCDDNDPGAKPEDNDGDGLTTCIDEFHRVDCDDADPSVGAVDEDEDGHLMCLDDCDDQDPWTHVGAAELDSETACMRDMDQDGWGDPDPQNEAISPGADCDDSIYELSPSDNDGDGVTGCEGDCDDSDGETGVIDLDGDGQSSCFLDCDDNDPDVYLGAAANETEICTRDIDGDGWGDSEFSEEGSDCDDNDPGTNPLSDQDSDGALACVEDCDDKDPAMNISDADADGHSSCDGDCDDSDPQIFPGAVAESAPDECMIDADGDGYGDNQVEHPYTPGSDCNDNDGAVNIIDADADGYLGCDDDCDDQNPEIHPDAIEIYYDGVDQNCDGLSDYDADQDGDPSNQHNGFDCDDTDPVLNSNDLDSDGYSSCDGDCDDGDGFTYPGAAYNDSPVECLTDQDGDGYGPLFSPDGCINLVMTDSYGDSWNGGHYIITTDTGEVQNSSLPESTSTWFGINYEQPQGSFYNDGSSNPLIEELCYPESTLRLFLNYHSGVFDGENLLEITVNGTSIHTQFVQDSFEILVGGSDSDDSDASVH